MLTSLCTPFKAFKVVSDTILVLCLLDIRYEADEYLSLQHTELSSRLTA